jgi:hypothetical protein
MELNKKYGKSGALIQLMNKLTLKLSKGYRSYARKHFISIN